MPKQASWLAVFEAELFAFPGSKRHDKINSVSQVLASMGSSYGMLDVV